MVTRVPGIKFDYADFKMSGQLFGTFVLPTELWSSSDAIRFKWLNKQIGGEIKGTSWHHSEIPGDVHLVPFGIHNITTHNGGRTKGHWSYCVTR